MRTLICKVCLDYLTRWLQSYRFLDMKTTTREEREMEPQPFAKRAEVIHISTLRKLRAKRAANAKAISVENRNLSRAW